MTSTDVTLKARFSETVLIVEDEVLIRLVISEYLRDCGYRVIEAANADEALVVLKQEELVIDIVLSDVEMPGSMDGFGLARWIREHRTGLDVNSSGEPQARRRSCRRFVRRGTRPCQAIRHSDRGRSHKAIARQTKPHTIAQAKPD